MLIAACGFRIVGIDASPRIRPPIEVIGSEQDLRIAQLSGPLTGELRAHQSLDRVARRPVMIPPRESLFTAVVKNGRSNGASVDVASTRRVNGDDRVKRDCASTGTLKR
jgi:hypothetical protein